MLLQILIIYHAHCPDGSVGAWVAYQKFADTAEYMPLKRGEELPADEVFRGRDVYIIDYSFDRETNLKIESLANRLVILDHHMSSAADVKAVREHVYSDTHSGAYIAWQYFYPDLPVPNLIQYISEGDMYNYTLPDWEHYMPAIYGRDMTFANIDILNKLMSSAEGRAELRKESALLKGYETKILNAALESVHWVDFEGLTIPAVNVCLPMDERSELLRQIYNMYPPIALSYRWDEGQWKCSLRGNGEVDCAALASKYGGGGHHNSAGFAVPGSMPLPFAIASNKVV